MSYSQKGKLLTIHLLIDDEDHEITALCGFMEAGQMGECAIGLPLLRKEPVKQHERICEKCLAHPKYPMLLLKNLNE